MPESSAAPPLPINSKNRSSASDGLSLQKGTQGRQDRRKKTLEVPGNKAWADYTPTPFDGYGPTPWTNKMMAGYGPGAFGPCMPGFLPGFPVPQEGEDAQLPDHPKGSPSATGPTPKVWPNTPTPTPGAQPSMQFGFGIPGMPMPPMPGGPFPRPPDFSSFAQAAQDAAKAAAVAAAAAGSPETTGGSPGEDLSQGAPPFNDDYAGDFSSPPTAGMPGAPSAAMAPAFVPGPMGMVPPPSRGSQFHGTGKCRPCAWFYKPQGCQSELSCSYCHLCPEGELKERKKLKVAAMRMGALTQAKPSKSGRDHGNTRTLKLNPLL